MNRGLLAQTQNDLQTAVDVAWQQLPYATIYGLVDKMPHRKPLAGLKLASLKRRWLDGYSKWSSGYGINSKQVVLTPGRSTKIATEHRQLHRIATTTKVDNGSSALLVTLLLCLEEEFSGKHSTTLLQRLVLMSGVQSCASLWLHPAGSTGGAENINCEHHKNGGMFFSVKSRNKTRQSNCRRIFIGRENGARFHPSCVTKVDGFCGKGIIVHGGMLSGSRTPLYDFNACTVN
ncbi:hypothetical protein TNCV_5044131 [Trichonephila clavipes]|uniref:Uncharacterized protein n=1 Tax=Trichonephila clavipes TaxID=2585209 RepID=A0A8X6WHC3_TRICX|nr:hypothetical protein TNCV_5044131 [Trichonephila clavipes]